ncbi:MAG: THUMP domain-containing protein [Rhodocyclaceae bacterium]|nr:THUMP domain-containing protein [Rhodocyclaceae bacterium]
MTAIRRPLKSLDFITLRIKDAVCDRFRAETGERPSVDTVDPNVRIHAFLSDREATVYLDTSGEPLYKRGFKYASVEAPLKENLAAGILRLAGWQPGVPLLDPMCGSGTFLLEAAMMARHIAPGLERKFGFFRLANFDAALWQKLLSEAESRRLPAEPQPIFGSDISPDQVERARQNLAAAGMHECVQLECADLLLRNPPAAEGVLVANPPYGGSARKRNGWLLSSQAGRCAQAALCRLALLFHLGRPADAQVDRTQSIEAHAAVQRSIECRLLEYKMVSGQMRDRH